MEELIGTVSAYLAADSLIQLTVNASPQREGATPWTRIVARPVPKQQLRVDYKLDKATVTRLLAPNDLLALLKSVPQSELVSATIKVKSGQLFFNKDKTGHLVKSKNFDSMSDVAAPAHDDEPGNYVYSPRALPDFFQGLGIATQSHTVRAEKYKKFRQINEFIRIQKSYMGFLRALNPGARIVTLDFGCGNAYLTVAWHHFLNHMENIAAETIGIDQRPEPVKKLNKVVETYGLKGLSFTCSRVADFHREVHDDARIVFALHACDTATDEAIAQAIGCEADLVVLAPCCHHDVQKQMKDKQPIKPLRHLYRQGILRERLGDLVTDDLRAQILLLFGYKVDVFQFIDAEHTTKNIMIVAHSKRNEPQIGVGAYQDCKKFWGVEPQAERLLRDGGLWTRPDTRPGLSRGREGDGDAAN